MSTDKEHDIVLEVKNLKTFFYFNNTVNRAVNGVSFNIRKGRTLCVVGESGCGKSVTAHSIMRLLPDLSRIEEGSIVYHGKSGPVYIEQLEKNGKEMRQLRGGDIAMIFQDPMTALNPVYTIGFQIEEMLAEHTRLSKAERRERTLELLTKMGIPLPRQRIDEYPHQFSGGMRQRAVIAMAMACNPCVLIADEPTTALDVTIQAQIFELMEELKTKYSTAIMLITHDMGVVTELADDVIVMYMGHIIEKGTVDEVLRRPLHPYTQGLLRSIPILGKGKNQKLIPIRGSTPNPHNRPPGCQFAPRCDYCMEQCNRMPPEYRMGGSHTVRCWKAETSGEAEHE
ncbi:MAG: ABC transporter ATP-binding protein [Treponema sp.]